MSRRSTPRDVLEGRARWCVVEGEAFRTLLELPDCSIDAVITDPPYSSGGLFRGDRTLATDKKYTNTESQGERPDFAGDTRDQRAFLAWYALWGHEARRVSRPSPGGRLVVFTDWRQLGATIDAVQVSGWIYRGVAVWHKGAGSRPVPGGFRSECEFVVWGSVGALPVAAPGVGVHPGHVHAPVLADDKHHQTGKPTALLRELVKIAPKGGVVLDPFGGSGTTGVAAIAEGRRAILCELTPEYAEIARARCEAAEAGAPYVPGGTRQLGLEMGS